MKTCPFCAEKDLQDDATICKHCGRKISKAEKPFYLRYSGCAMLFAVIAVVLYIFIVWPLWMLAVLPFIQKK